MDLKRFFDGIGHLFARAISLVKENLSDAQLAKAVALVKDAEHKFLDNAQRREWVILELGKVAIPESMARILVEFALKLVKAKIDAGIDDVIAKA